MPIEVGSNLDRLYFGRHQFVGAVNLNLTSATCHVHQESNNNNLIESSPPVIISSEPFTNLEAEDIISSNADSVILPITFRQQVYLNGFDEDRQEFLSVILTSQVDESLQSYRLKTQVTAVVWIELISPAETAALNTENAVILVPKKSITLPIEQFCEVERIRETFSRLVERKILRQKCSNTAQSGETIRIHCKITIEPHFGSAEERIHLWFSRTRTYDLQLNFFTSSSRFGVKRKVLQAHQWMLMRAPGWRRFLFAHTYEANNTELNNPPTSSLKKLSIPAPSGLRLEAILEQLHFYYGLKWKSGASIKTIPSNFMHFVALVDVALFAEDRDFMAKLFSELLIACENVSEDELICQLDLPSALAFRRLAKRHNVLPVVEKYDALIVQIIEKTRRRIVEASDLVPLESILVLQPQVYSHPQMPSSDPVLNQLLYTLFDQRAVDCFLSVAGQVDKIGSGFSEEVVVNHLMAEENDDDASLDSAATSETTI